MDGKEMVIEIRKKRKKEKRKRKKKEKEKKKKNSRKTVIFSPAQPRNQNTKLHVVKLSNERRECKRG